MRSRRNSVQVLRSTGPAIGPSSLRPRYRHRTVG
ncbi:Protein of unknown function [Pyronema omphalodes CBS 100304]|uniref:Uncharacterized protein n=1 Tax=Pyronema omphalodes (strain CBS 100304) TaxID=1076935 RepID=U4LJH2_PYROM|nr:Protein of unknown function [Pyronema omphalodes CBS 100304]